MLADADGFYTAMRERLRRQGFIADVEDEKERAAGDELDPAEESRGFQSVQEAMD